MICTNISISHKSLTYLLVLQPKLLLLLVPSLHVHLVHAEPLEIRAVLVQELKQDQSGCELRPGHHWDFSSITRIL